MSWYKTGTIAVTNGSATVTGTGTTFVDNLRVGMALMLDDDTRLYEVTGIVSQTQFTISPAYLGTTRSGASYRIAPFSGGLTAATQALNNAIAAFNAYADGPLSGVFPAGSAAAPAITKTSDLDTGFFFPATNSLAVTTGGVQRLLMNTTTAKLDLPMTGTAVSQSNQDETTGRLMKLGDWGLGGNSVPFIADFAVSLRSGFYRYLEAATLGAPGSGSSYFGNVVVSRGDSGNTMLLAGRITPDAGNQRFFMGTRSTETGPITWSELWHANDIEVGDNANGQYFKYPDGRLETIKTLQFTGQNLNTAYGSLFRSDNLISGATVLPHGFVGDPDDISHQIQVQCSDFAVMQAVSGIGDLFNLPGTIYAVAPQSLTNRALRLRILSTGRWK